MSAQWKDIRAERLIRAKALALQIDGNAKIRHITPWERQALRRMEQKILSSGQRFAALDTWQGCLRSIHLNLDHPRCREFLPARDGRARIGYIAEWLWEIGENALTEEGIAALTSVCSDVQPLTYAEIWLLPQAIRLHALRCFLSDTRMLMQIIRSRALAEEFLQGDEWISGDDVFAEAVLRNADADSAEVHALLEQAGDTASAVIDRAHAQFSALAMRMEKARNVLRVLGEMQWQSHLAEISHAERLLMEDPGKVYPRLTEESKQQVRRVLQKISDRSNLGEGRIVRTAMQLCKDRQVADLTQVLYTDFGLKLLQKALGIPDNSQYRLHSDLEGRKIICGSSAIALILLIVYLLSTGEFLFALIGVPLIWKAARQIFNRAASAIFPATPLLRLQIAEIPNELRTLAVIPAKIATQKELEARLSELRIFHAMHREEALEFLLLADLPDAPSAEMPDDSPLMEASFCLTSEMNRAAGRNCFHVLWRERIWNNADRIFQPKERKRGALMALYALLTGEKSEFLPHTTAESLRNAAFRYVITMDAGTMIQPDSLRHLVGAMAWPGNRYSVIQPCMHSAMRMKPTVLDRVIAPEAGISSYSTAAGDVYQDMTGRGIFGGKGIVDVAAFRLALENRLPDNAILSHDLIEGALSGAGFAGDIAWFEHHPGTLRGMLSRFERWTRGDWQLLPFLLDKNQPLDGLSRFQMADNLLHSLAYPSALSTMILAAWKGLPGTILAILACLALPVLLHLRAADPWKIRSWLAEICLLPYHTWTAISAIVRALFRTYISHQHMLDWKTADSADVRGGVSPYPGVFAALLLIPSMRHGQMWLLSALLGALFMLGKAWLEQPRKAEKPLDDLHRSLLQDIARRTWNFFESHVNADENFLPPDNVQIDPPAGTAHRTSPTNIGLYLLSCLCAAQMSMISREAMERRLADTLTTLEQLPRWKGHLYNWYDTRTLQPLTPMYVSSVDSGNLAACLLAISASDLPEHLCYRAKFLAAQMDFSELYDGRRGLFHIGMDVSAGVLSPSCYDLYASEARSLSLSAIALRQIPASHWQKLGRPFAPVQGEAAHISWSGTMFEYLMPEILFSAPEDSAWSRSSRAVIDLQRMHAVDGMWGVSESGYHAFDQDMNYQYRAFGLSEISFEGLAPGGVIAPYAAALALKHRPREAAETLLQMCDNGFSTKFGMIEAIDMRSGTPQKVMSHMAHHQGMILCAIANALHGDFLCELTTRLPEFAALQPLLQEKSDLHPRFRRAKLPAYPVTQHLPKIFRIAVAGDMHLMRGRDSAYATSADGHGRLMMQDRLISRDMEDPTREADGIALLIHSEDFCGAIRRRENIQCEIEPGCIRFIMNSASLSLKSTACISPETGAWIQQIELENRSEHPQKLQLTSAFPVAMMSLPEMRAHPIFHNLFIHSRRTGQHAIGFTRRSREPEADPRMLIHLASGADLVEWESDAEKFYGRNRGALDDALADTPLHGTLGHVLRPCSALRAHVQLAVGEKRKLHFAIGMTDENGADEWIRQHESTDFARRAIIFAQSQAEALLSFEGISREMYAPMERACAKLLFPRRYRDWLPMKKPDLWRYGISGDRAMIGVQITDAEAIPLLRDVCRIRNYYRSMGIETDLILFTKAENGYLRPLTEQIRNVLPQDEHVCIIDMDQCEQHAAIFSLCALQFGGDMSIADQLHSQIQHQSASSVPMQESLRAATLSDMPKNGHGRMIDGGKYEIIASQAHPTPAPWSNILAGEDFGTLITERGGGFTWAGNSYDMRLTRFYNQALREGWSERISLIDAQRGRRIDGYPHPENPLTFRVIHGDASTKFIPVYPELPFEIETGISTQHRAKFFLIRCNTDRPLRASLQIDWLMGSSVDDLRFLCSRKQGQVCFARGNMDGVGYLTCIHGKHAQAAGQGDGVSAEFHEGIACFALGWAHDEAEAQQMITKMSRLGGEKLLQMAECEAAKRLGCLKIDTPDGDLNDFVNHFLPRQVFHSRVYGRTGLYQGGGAFGFRDQLQDMLCVMYFRPELARRHILNCAAHQFESGDVMHWWHPPHRGVRTKISDDMLFLPYVCTIYAQETGDMGIFDEEIPFLQDKDIPEGQEDLYFEAQPTMQAASLREHCLRALTRADNRGTHGLIRIGSGDWNDGMNRVGAQGNGESIWLTQFLCHVIETADLWMDPQMHQAWMDRRKELMQALETHGWDGQWYLRAYDDNGKPLGGKDCEAMRIDCLSQAWAQIAGLSPERTDSAIRAAKEQLVDESLGIVRLLTPAFDMHLGDPGYIRAYPPGIRENGGQYTHAACWLLRAITQRGETADAAKILQMLLPYNHARTPEEAAKYRVEPYVMAADIGGEGINAGRGGWTWYTGSAAWFYRVIVQDILGFERRGNRVRLNSLPMPGWTQARLALQFGNSRYTLISRISCAVPTLDETSLNGEWIELTDDGRDHIAEFTMRKSAQ